VRQSNVVYSLLGKKLNNKEDCRVGKYTQLSITERRQFYVFLEMGLTLTAIAQRLSRHRSTLYRELKRNKEEEGYFPIVAHEKTKERRQDKRMGKIQTDGILRDYIVRSLQ
jgi:IS30 family transposase